MFKVVGYLIRYTFYILVFKNVYKYFLVFFSTLLAVTVLVPIMQVEWDLLKKQNEIIQKSSKFDVFYKLPNHQTFLKLKDQKLLDGEKFNFTQDVVREIESENKSQYSFQSFFSSKAKYIDFKNKKYFSFESAFSTNSLDKPTINKVSLIAGRLPTGKEMEVVVNSKFAKLNRLGLGSQLKIFGQMFLVVGIGDSVQNLSLNFKEIFKVQQSLNLKDSDNLYANTAIVYVNEQLFLETYKTKAFTNFDNFWYLKFPSTSNIKVNDNVLLRAVKQKMNYDPEIVTFESDLSSGLKQNFSYIELIIFAIIWFFIFIFISFLLCYLVSYSFQKRKNFLHFLRVMGFSKLRIASSYFLVNFTLLFFATVVGYFLGFALNDYFVFSNNKLFFSFLEFQPFQWNFFIFTTFGVSLVLGLISFFFILIKLRNASFSFQKHDFFPSFYSTKTKMLPTKFSRVFPFFGSSSKIKLFLLFFFQNFWKKILLLNFIILLFTLSFFLIFIKVASDNFISNQWGFLNKDIKSFTKLQNHIFLNKKTNNFESNIDFVSDDNRRIKDLKKINNLKEITLNPLCYVAKKPEEFKKVKLNCSLKNKFLDQTIESTRVQSYMKNFNVNKVYFNLLPYQKEQEILILQLNVANKKLISNIYFMPTNWQEYFNLDQLESKLKGFEFQEDGLLGTDSGGVQYALAPYRWKEQGYQLGDVVSFPGFSLDRVFLQHELQFRIAGFIKKDNLIQSSLFTDYNYLLYEKIVSSSKPFYNFIFSKTQQKHLNRSLVLDLSGVDLENLFQILKEQKFDLTLLSPINLRSLTLTEFQNLSSYHFKIYQVYFVVLIAVGIFFVFLFLLLLFTFIIEDYEKDIRNLLTFGHRLWEIIWGFLLVTVLLSLIGLVVALLITFIFFSLFKGYFEQLNVYLVVPKLWNYLLYAIFPIFFILASNIIYNFVYLQKRSKPSFDY